MKLARPSDVVELLTSTLGLKVKRAQVCVPIMPLVRNTLASAKRRSESLALEASIAAGRLAQMPEKKRQRNRGKKKGPSPPLPKLKRLELSTLSNCAVLIAEDVARMDTVYFHLAAGVIATINVARLQRITAADSVTAADLF